MWRGSTVAWFWLGGFVVLSTSCTHSEPPRSSLGLIRPYLLMLPFWVWVPFFLNFGTQRSTFMNLRPQKPCSIIHRTWGSHLIRSQECYRDKWLHICSVWSWHSISLLRPNLNHRSLSLLVILGLKSSPGKHSENPTISHDSLVTISQVYGTTIS